MDLRTKYTYIYMDSAHTQWLRKNTNKINLKLLFKSHSSTFELIFLHSFHSVHILHFIFFLAHGKFLMSWLCFVPKYIYQTICIYKNPFKPKITKELFLLKSDVLSLITVSKWKRNKRMKNTMHTYFTGRYWHFTQKVTFSHWNTKGLLNK